MNRVNCKDVGDNDGFFECEAPADEPKRPGDMSLEAMVAELKSLGVTAFPEEPRNDLEYELWAARWEKRCSDEG